MKVILCIIAVILAVAYVGSYLVILHFLKQTVNKMQEIQDKGKDKNNG